MLFIVKGVSKAPIKTKPTLMFFEITIFYASEKPDLVKKLKTINDYRYDNFSDRNEF